MSFGRNHRLANASNFGSMIFSVTGMRIPLPQRDDPRVEERYERDTYRPIKARSGRRPKPRATLCRNDKFDR